MAFIKYRGNTTTPGTWTATAAASAPLTNLDIDKNFASLDAQKVNTTDTIATNRGGTGLTSYVAGDILYASATNTLAKLAKGTDGQFLKLASGVPSWAADNNTTYTTATSATLGLVKIGYTESGKNYPVELSSDKMYVNVPWTDTTYTTATNAALGLVKIGYADNGKNYAVELSSDKMYVNVPWTDTTYSTATSATLGLVKIGYTESGKNYPVELSDEKMYVNVPWTDTVYTLPLAANGTRGGVQIGYAENGKNYPVELSGEKMYVNVPWTDNNTDTLQSISATTSASTHYISFVSSTSGALTGLVNTNITATPSTGTINASNFTSTSDIRFKSELETISSALDKVKTLTGYTFTMIETGQRSTGLIAQDVEKVLPEAVSGDENKKTVNYGAMMGLIVQALKEIDDKLTLIQKQIEDK